MSCWRPSILWRSEIPPTPGRTTSCRVTGGSPPPRCEFLCWRPGHDHRMSDKPITEIPEAVSGPGRVELPEQAPGESVEEPPKVLRLGSLILPLLEAARQAPLDDASRMRLKE